MEDLHYRVVCLSLDSIINTCNNCIHELKRKSSMPNELDNVVTKHLKILNDIIICHKLIEIDNSIFVLKSLIDNLNRDIKVINSETGSGFFNDYTFYKNNISTIRFTASNIQNSKYHYIY